MSETNGIDPRVAEAVSIKPRTSLSEFLGAKQEPAQDDTSTDESSTDSTNTVEQPTTTDDKTGDGPNTTSGDNDTVFDVKGEKIPLKDLINSYETRQEISRRFGELGTEKKRIEAERERIRKEKDEITYINEKFEEMREEVLNGNSLAALQIAITMANAGGDIKDTATKDLIKQAITIAENFHNMSEDEQALFLDKQEVEIKQKRLDRATEKQKKEADRKALEDYYNNLLTEHKVQESELEEALADIQSMPKHKEELEKRQGDRERLGYCVSWVLGKRLNKTVSAGIAKVDPELAKDEKFRLVLLDYVDPRCTVDEVAGIVKEYLQPKSSDNSAKVETAASKQSADLKQTANSNRAPTEKPKAEKKNVPITSWADLVAKHST